MLSENRFSSCTVKEHEFRSMDNIVALQLCALENLTHFLLPFPSNVILTSVVYIDRPIPNKRLQGNVPRGFSGERVGTS